MCVDGPNTRITSWTSSVWQSALHRQLWFYSTKAKSFFYQWSWVLRIFGLKCRIHAPQTEVAMLLYGTAFMSSVLIVDCGWICVASCALSKRIRKSIQLLPVFESNLRSCMTEPANGENLFHPLLVHRCWNEDKTLSNGPNSSRHHDPWAALLGLLETFLDISLDLSFGSFPSVQSFFLTFCFLEQMCLWKRNRDLLSWMKLVLRTRYPVIILEMIVFPGILFTEYTEQNIQYTV